jgi:hypothetical protein
MAATFPLTLAGWNEILTRINNLAANPPEGCDALATIDLVFDPHKWSTNDIQVARNKLTAICSDNAFPSSDSGRWLASIIDELNDAIDAGWCNCEEEIPCCVPQGTVTYREYGSDYDVTTPLWQCLESYLMGLVDYSVIANALPTGVMAALEVCVGDPANELIYHWASHTWWTEVQKKAFWASGGLRTDLEPYWQTYSADQTEIVDEGYLTSISASYVNSVSYGSESAFPWEQCDGWILDPGSGMFYHWCNVALREVNWYHYDFDIKTCY